MPQDLRQWLQQAHVDLDKLLRGLTTMPDAQGPNREDRKRAQRERNM